MSPPPAGPTEAVAESSKVAAVRRFFCFLLCCILLCGLLPLSTMAADFQVTCYYEEIYAGGIMDLWAFTGDNGKKPFTYQWQAQGYGWIDLQDNAAYSGTRTDHLQIHTQIGDYGDFDAIPFQCVVTDADGDTRYTPHIYMKIYPTSGLIPNLQRLGYELYEPTIKGAINLHTSDYENYTAYAYAGTKLDMLCGGTPLTHAIFKNSEVELSRQIHITENGQTTKVGDSTTYIPYTVGTVTVQMKMRLSIAGTDLGDYDTKTIKITTSKPTVISTAKTTGACSLLRHTYNESQKLASIPKGAAVEIVGKEGSYYQVFYNNMVGYVGSSLLDVQSGYDPVIRNVDVKIAAPAAGQKPAATCQVLTSGCALYKTEPITWFDRTNNRSMGANDTFQRGHSYSVSIWLSAESGYKFQTDAAGNPKLTGSINGNLMPTVNKAYEQDPEQVIEYYYIFTNVQPGSSAPETHTCKPVLVPRVEPTCKQPGHEAYYLCQCGMQYADAAGTQEINASFWGVLPITPHVPSSWRIGEQSHYKVCTSCGDKLEESIHQGGTATCTQKAKCTVCGYSYGAAVNDHKWSPTYLYKDDTGHAWICADCKQNSPVEPHTPGPAATKDTPQTCKDCGYIIEPAKDHTHSLTRVPARDATCTENGNLEYYTCDGCSDWFLKPDGTQKAENKSALILTALGHFSDQWKFDRDLHWQLCRVCDQVIEEGKAVHQDSDGDNTCDICGYRFGTELPVEEESTPTQPREESSDSGKKGISLDAAWLIAIPVAVFCFAATALTVILIKKKKQ